MKKLKIHSSSSSKDQILSKIRVESQQKETENIQLHAYAYNIAQEVAFRSWTTEGRICLESCAAV